MSIHSIQLPLKSDVQWSLHSSRNRQLRDLCGNVDHAENTDPLVHWIALWNLEDLEARICLPSGVMNP